MLLVLVSIQEVQERPTTPDYDEPLLEESSNAADKDVDPLQLDSEPCAEMPTSQTNFDIVNVFSMSEDSLEACFDDLTAEEVICLSDTTTKQNLQVLITYFFKNYSVIYVIKKMNTDYKIVLIIENDTRKIKIKITKLVELRIIERFQA